jgi:hypothetical protein
VGRERGRLLAHSATLVATRGGWVCLFALRVVWVAMPLPLGPPSAPCAPPLLTTQSMVPPPSLPAFPVPLACSLLMVQPLACPHAPQGTGAWHPPALLALPAPPMHCPPPPLLPTARFVQPGITRRQGVPHVRHAPPVHTTSSMPPPPPPPACSARLGHTQPRLGPPPSAPLAQQPWGMPAEGAPPPLLA